ncbi:MAG: SAM-dependent methyltransferase [Lentimicrobiaceae bacterium]|jgi:16S rRNA (cytidine1402-2'-O)-methyltransferase|nr:SAM-dependent methyltransferase [Lentimicrobiaceae bacterium]
MNKTTSTIGKLFLIPTLLGNTTPESVLPEGTLKIVREIRFFIVENIRTTRRTLSKIGMGNLIDSIEFIELNKHKNANMMDYLGVAFEGNNIGLMSEAGTPCVADPGSVVVEMAHQAGIQVVPLSGPNALIMALMGSGFNGQVFAFHGYLPINERERINAIKNLEKRSMIYNETEIFIETPFRNNALLETLSQHCSAATRLCIASNITMPDEQILSLPIADWKGMKIDLNKKPAVFLIYNSGENRYFEKGKKKGR